MTEINSVVRNTENQNEDPYTGKNHYGYTMGEKLGEGGIGVVYVGVNDKGEKAAIKFLKEEKPEFISALRREARIQQNIDDPGLLKVLAVHDKAIITEYEDGMKALDIENLSPYDLQGITLQVIDVLERLHSKGIIHSDLKPGNIIVTKDGDIKIADCGLAKIVAKHTNFVNTAVGTMSVHNGKNGWEGTPGYLPGNLEELKEPAPSLDILEFGKVLYQMIMGSPNKFPGMSSLPKLKKACSDKGLPDIVADLVAQMTEEDKEDRIQDIAQLKRTEGYRKIKEADGQPVLDIIFLNKFGLNLHDRCDNTGHYGQIYSIVPQLNPAEFAEFVRNINPLKIKNHHDGDLAISMICAYLENFVEDQDAANICFREKIEKICGNFVEKSNFYFDIGDRLKRLNLFLEKPVAERKHISFASYEKYNKRISQAKTKKELDEIRYELDAKHGDFAKGISNKHLNSLQRDLDEQLEKLGIKPEPEQTEESFWERILKMSFSDGGDGYDFYPYLQSGLAGGFLGGMMGLYLCQFHNANPDIAGGSILLGAGVGLSTMLGLRAYSVWKKAKDKEIEKVKEIQLSDILESYDCFKNLARAVKCCGGTEIKGIDRQQIGEEVRKYSLRSDKEWFRKPRRSLRKLLEDAMSNESLLHEIEKPGNIGVITRFDVRKDILRGNYCEMDITIYEKKNKIDEKIEKEVRDIFEDGEKKHTLIVEKQPTADQYISLNQEHASSELDEERDLMTERPKPFLELEKQVKEGRKIILLPPTQEKNLRQVIEEEIQSEGLKQDGKSIKQRLNEKMGSFFDKPADTNAEAVPEQMPKPLVQETYKEPEQPLPAPVQEAYQKPESPVQEQEITEEEQDDEESDDDEQKDNRMLEQ